TLGQYSKGDVNENLYGTSAGRTPIGYVIGQMALAQGRLGPPLAPVAVAASWVGTATIYEDNDLHWYEWHLEAGLRPFGMGFLAGAPGGGVGVPLAMAVAAYPFDVTSRSLTQWRIMDRTFKAEAERLVDAELGDFEAGLRALAAKPEEAAKFVTDVNDGKE